MKIVVMGSGAIGNLYGGLLKIAGNDVTLVGREPHINAIVSRGLIIKGVFGNHNVHLEALTSPDTIDSAELILITTKSYDTVSAAGSVQHLVDNGAYVVCLQNGLGTELLVADALKTHRVLRATTCVGALMTDEGEVTATGKGLTEIGSHYHENMEMIGRLAEILDKAGFEVLASDNIAGVVWTKTIVNCGINPIAALTGLTNGEIFNDMGLRQLIIKLVEEAAAVAEALNIRLSTDDPIRYTLGTAKATSDNINSMLQDVCACKRTEIDAITGEIIRLARELGIDVPYSESIYALVKALEAKRLAKKERKPVAPKMGAQELIETLSTP